MPPEMALTKAAVVPNSNDDDEAMTGTMFNRVDDNDADRGLLLPRGGGRDAGLVWNNNEPCCCCCCDFLGLLESVGFCIRIKWLGCCIVCGA